MSEQGRLEVWQKGGPSPNPGGKQVGLEAKLRELRREILDRSGGPKYFADKLLEFVQFAPDHKDKLTALKLLMEYGFGKPVQNVHVDGEGAGGIQIIVNTGVIQPERAGELPASAVMVVDTKHKPLAINEMVRPEMMPAPSPKS